MSIDHILSSITNTPLMITPDKLAIIMDVLKQKQPLSIDFGKIQIAGNAGAPPSAALLPTPARQAHGAAGLGIAVIDVCGSLVNRQAPGDSGIANYRNIRQSLSEAANDTGVGGIIIDFDSFGGMAAGADRLARDIRAAAAVKPVYAYVDTAAYSAAYYLAAACSKIILADNDSGVGSIGVIAIHRDQSAKNEKDGYKYTAIFSGSRKTDYSPHGPLSDDLAAELQASVDKTRLVFATAVAGFRNLQVDDVLATEAGVYHGMDAVRMGLADEVANFDETVAMLIAAMAKNEKYGNNEKESGGAMGTNAENKKSGEMDMTTKERFAALLANDDAPAALAELGYFAEDGTELAERIDTAAAAAYTSGMEAAGKLLAMVDLAGAPLAIASDLIDKNVSYDDAAQVIQDYRAAAAASPVLSTINEQTGTGKHPLIAKTEQLAAA